MKTVCSFLSCTVSRTSNKGVFSQVLHCVCFAALFLVVFSAAVLPAVAANYYWRLNGTNGDWSLPSNWSLVGFGGAPAATTPSGAADVAYFNLPCYMCPANTPLTLTNLPPAGVGAINGIALQRPIWIPAGETLRLLSTGSAMGGNASFSILPGATLQLADGASIVHGAGSPSWYISGTLELIGAASVSTVSMNISGPMAALVYSGTTPKVVGNEFYDVYQIGLYSAGIPLAVPITISNTGGVTMSGGGTYNIGSNLTITAGASLTVDAGTTLNNGGTVNVNAGGTLRFNNTGAYTGTSPVYAVGSQLQYTGTMPKIVGTEIPTGVAMNGNIIISNTSAGGITLGAFTYQLYAGMTMNAGSVLALGNGTILDLFGGTFCWGGSLQGNSGASLRFMGAIIQICTCINFVAPQELADLTLNASGMGLGSNLTVLGNLTVAAGQQLEVGACGTPTLTLSGLSKTVAGANGIRVYPGATLEINGGVPITGLGTVQFDAGPPRSNLRYTGVTAITFDKEFPLAMNGNVILNKTAFAFNGQTRSIFGTLNIQTSTLNLNSSLTLNGVSTIQSGAGLTINAATLNGAGNLTVNGGGTLSMNGTSPICIGTPFYMPNSLLLYNGSGGGISTGGEFPTLPTTMQGNVQINKVATTDGIYTTGNKQIDGSFSLSSGFCQIGAGTTFTLSGAVTFNAPTGIMRGDPTGVLSIAGIGAITGNAAFETGFQQMQQLTMNRGGQILNLGTNLILTGNPALTLNNGNVRVAAGATLWVNNNLVTAQTTGGPTSFIELAAFSSVYRRDIQGGVGTWNFPVGNPTTGYMPLTLIDPDANVSPQIRSATGAGGTANGTTTIMNPMQNPWWVVFPNVPFNARVQAGYTGVALTHKLGITSPTDFGTVYNGVGGSTPDTFNAGPPATLRSANPTAFTTFDNFIRIGTALPTTYFYCPTCGADPTIAANWRDNGLPGGIAAPGFFPGYTFRIPSGVTASYTTTWNVPAGLTYQVDNGGTLEFDGDVNFTGNNITYQSNLATVRYINGSISGGTGTEVPTAPTTMIGSVVVNRGMLTDFYINNTKIFNGSFTITGGLVRTNGFNHSFNSAPTSLTLNGTNAWFYVNGGTTTLNQNAILNAGRITLGNATPLSIAAGRTLAVSGTGVLELFEFMGTNPQITGMGAATFTPSATLRFTNGWNGTVNLNTLPTPFDGTLDIVNGTPTLAVNRTLQGNIAITTGLLNVGMNVALTLSGAGTITTTGVNRIDAQTQAGAGIISQRATLDGNWFNLNAVNNLTIAAASTLTNPLTVNAGLTLSNGIFTTSTTSILSIGSAVMTITGGAPTRYINGPVRVDFPFPGTTTKIIPTGRNSSYLPITLQNIAASMPPPLFELEAYNYNCNGTAVVRPLGNEHWRVQTISGSFSSGQLVLGTMSPIAADASIGYAPAPAFRDGVYGLFPMATVMMGSPNTVQVTLPGAPNDFLAIAGSAPTTFYYQSNNADSVANWNSNFNGGGSQPSSFASGTFIVPNGLTAPFTNPATFGGSTILQVESGGAITVANGRTLTAGGQFWINARGRLTLQGTGNVAASNGVQYLASNAILEYNAPVNRTTTITEFPDVMTGGLVVSNGTITLDASKHLQSSLLVNNSTVNFNNADRLRISGALTLSGTCNFGTDATDTLILDGAGAITGSLGISQLARLNMQRNGQTLNLAGTLRIAQQLRLLGGNIATRTNESLVLQNSADTALLGGNSASFVSGAFVRQLRANQTPATAPQIFYPMGSGSTYLPLLLTESTTGSVAPQVGVSTQAIGAGGTVAPGVNGSLSTTEYWRVAAVSGDFTGARIGLTRSVLPQNPLVASSPAQGGAYASNGGTLTGSANGSFVLSDGVPVSPDRYFAFIGTRPNAPRIMGFSPSSGGIGTMILVTGASFTGVSAVAIAGVPVASFTVVTDSLITASVANGVSGAVQVTSPIGGASSDSTFRFIPPPSLGLVLPNPAGFGTPITISGANLQNTISLSIGGVQIPITPAIFTPSGNIAVTVPPNASNGTISIVTPGGSIESTSALVLVPRPVILSVAPQVAGTGEVITLIGRNFENTRFVRFGGGTSGVALANAGFTLNSPTRISVVVPPQVRIPQSTTSTLAFERFFEKQTSSLNAVNGMVPITVETPGGIATAGTLAANEFYYRTTTAVGSGSGGGPDPFQLIRVDAILDKISTLGGRVRVTGANLDFIVGIRLTTSLGATLASYQLGKSDMTILVPATGLLANTTQTVSSVATTIEFFGAYNFVTVTNAFVLAGVPLVTSIQPPNAEVGGNIFVSGTNLNLVTQVSIGGVNVPFQILPNGQVLVRVPVQPNTTGSTSPLAGTLVLTGVGGATSASTTLINAAYLTNQPVITSFSPSGGAGGTVIVVTGANFSAVNDVLVGGLPVASFVINSPNRITLVLSTQASARSAGAIQLATASGIVESRQSFQFSTSLESDVQSLATLLGLSVSDVQARIVQEMNRIVSLDVSNIPLNVDWANLFAANSPLPSYLRSLRVLNLSNTGLTGKIPAWFANLSELEELDISKNSLTGELSSGVVCRYRNLRLLNVSFNRLDGPVPACIATLDKVQTLRLHNNRFTEKIPLEFGFMRSLRELTMQNNLLEGTLPPSFGTTLKTLAQSKQTAQTQAAQTLEIIDASNNQLSGGIPPEWGGMTALKTLNLSGNRLSGTLPTELGTMRFLEQLLLANNRFSGALPANMSGLENVQVLNLANNSFVGAIPPEWSVLKRLRTMRLNGNGLTALVDWASARKLDTVEVQQNRLNFADIEQFVSIRQQPNSMVNYSPQDSIGAPSTTEARIGENATLSANVGGTANTYSWFKDGILVQHSAQAILRLPMVTRSDAGVYTCQVTSSIVSGLTLWTRAQTLTITTGGLTLARPNLVYPSNRAENIGVQTRVEWTRSLGAEGYEVQWARDEFFREGSERRYVASIPNDTSNQANTRLTGLERGAAFFWRVRALSGDGSLANEANASNWSETRTFTVVPLGVDLAVGTLDAGKVSIGDNSTGRSVAVNVGTNSLIIDNISVDAADTAQFRLKTAIAQGSGIVLGSGSELPIELVFTPRAAGLVTGTLRVKYRDGQGTARETSFRAVARGNGSALSVETVNFDTMRVGKTTLRTALLVNRSSAIVRVRGVEIPLTRTQARDSAVFTLRNAPTNTDPVLMAAGDTLTVVVAARPTASGVQTSTLRIAIENQNGGGVDTAIAEVRGIARLVQSNDPVLNIGIRPSADSVAPGGLVQMEVYIIAGNKANILKAAQPLVRGTVRYSNQVLSLVRESSAARVIRERTGTSTFERVNIPSSQWDGKSDVLFTFAARAVAGNTDRTVVQIESILWGGDNAQAQRQPWESQVFVEEPKDTVFTAKACLAGGKRMVTNAKASALAVLRPNPVKDMAELSLTLREDDNIRVELVNMAGKVIKTVAEGDYAAGEYTLSVNCADVPSGTYLVRLTTQNGVLTRSVQVVR